MTQKEMLIKSLLEIYKDDTAPLVFYFTEDEAEYVANCLIESGAIVPPCRVGDTLYCISSHALNLIKMGIEPSITICEVDALHITAGKNELGHKKSSHALVRNKNMRSLSSRIYFDDIGKTAFLTKKEAEYRIQALKGGAE